MPVACDKFNVTPKVITVLVRTPVCKRPIFEGVITSLLGQGSWWSPCQREFASTGSHGEADPGSHCLSPPTLPLLPLHGSALSPGTATSAKLCCSTKQAQGWAWGPEERNKSKLNPAVIHGMLAGSWKTGIKHICFVAEGCLHLQLQLSPSKGAGFLFPGGLSSTE